MRELLLVIVLVVVFAALGAVALVSWRTLFYVSIWLVVIGIVVGVPTGFIYHVLLYRKLKPRDEIPRGWVWGPIRLNAKLTPRERLLVLPWCYVGAMGFFVIIVGFVLIVASMILAQSQGV
ncbi:MAG: hypothetical protein GY854_05035 [Deltaproteobacteria bacterium]|nr:hypothetical protein [Deltaproteobacteria bacterium]